MDSLEKEDPHKEIKDVLKDMTNHMKGLGYSESRLSLTLDILSMEHGEKLIHQSPYVGTVADLPFILFVEDSVCTAEQHGSFTMFDPDDEELGHVQMHDEEVGAEYITPNGDSVKLSQMLVPLEDPSEEEKADITLIKFQLVNEDCIMSNKSVNEPMEKSPLNYSEATPVPMIRAYVYPRKIRQKLREEAENDVPN